jgi:hypothetical protein
VSGSGGETGPDTGRPSEAKAHGGPTSTDVQIDGSTGVSIVHVDSRTSPGPVVAVSIVGASPSLVSGESESDDDEQATRATSATAANDLTRSF